MPEIQAGSSRGAESRELVISTAKTGPPACSSRCAFLAGAWTANLKRVFEAFYSTKPGGFGIGLSICRSIIEAHGGRLWAAANTPQGAVFRFTVPAEPLATQ